MSKIGCVADALYLVSFRCCEFGLNVQDIYTISNARAATLYCSKRTLPFHFVKAPTVMITFNLVKFVAVESFS